VSDPGPAEQAPPPARRKLPWLKLVLTASLALNLLLVGAMAARFFVHGPRERIMGVSYMQLVPRRFFADLDRARREELLGVLKNYRDRFRAGQQNTRKLAESLAAALDATPYDVDKTRTVLGEFERNGAGLVALGSEAAAEFVARLTPEERAQLAQRIRDRAAGGRRR
jgi:uncharacterized membrane protein